VQVATLVCWLCVIPVQSQGQYWWLGTQAFRGDSQQNTQQTSTKQLTLHNEEKNQKQVEQNQDRLPLHDNKDIKQHPVENSPALQSLVEDDNQGIPFQDLPQTECPQGMQCVMEQFCDNEGFISSTRRELSKKDRKKRGELIPCINTDTAMFDVCCKIQKIQLLQSTAGKQKISSNTQQVSVSSVKKSPCPVIHSLPPVSSCEGQSSSCFNVGKKDVDCGGKVCCFNGCANICISQKPQEKKKLQKPRPPKKTSQRPKSKQPSAPGKFLKVQCPSAMRCVPKSNCNFSGLISSTPVHLTQLQEEWRIPLSPCVNIKQKNIVHVCCRE